jgi:hypothetical protein
MNFFKKLFNLPIKEAKEINKQEVKLSLDDLFVQNFMEKGGKFLYCIKNQEVIDSFKNILSENNWKEVGLLDNKLTSFLKNNAARALKPYKEETPIFTSCEHLISDSGDILFSSNQLGSIKLREYPDNFIVYATTRQFVKDTGQALTGIKSNWTKKLPTNISAVKNYIINKKDDNYLNYGNSNSKNLYLLLLEDL